ncbi:hypothetical protein TI04_00350 [Achromatium sp. WMS2]|nr:hypothetical protein TI04_00350 [Achromatium sp. WMS2]
MSSQANIKVRCHNCFEILSNKSAACSNCGHTNSDTIDANLLKPFTKLFHDHYLIGCPIGQPGGFGVVYSALDIGINYNVAIKEYFPYTNNKLAMRISGTFTVLPHAETKQSFDEWKARFLEEARLLVISKHPRIVDVKTVFQENNTAYMVMERLYGLTLAKYMGGLTSTPDLRMAFIKKLIPQQAIGLFNNLLEPLEFLHSLENPIVHRDLNPNNIFLVDGKIDNVKLLDFGLAKKCSTTSCGGNASTSLGCGSPNFAAPEQLSSEYGDITPATDCYSLGVCVYALLTGTTPFTATLRKSIELASPLADIRDLVPNVSADFGALIMDCVQLDPKQRPQSAAAIRERLQNMVLIDESRGLYVGPDTPIGSTILPGFNEIKPENINPKIQEDVHKPSPVDLDKTRVLRPKPRSKTRLLLLMVILLAVANAAIFIAKANGWIAGYFADTPVIINKPDNGSSESRQPALRSASKPKPVVISTSTQQPPVPLVISKPDLKPEPGSVIVPPPPQPLVNESTFIGYLESKHLSIDSKGNALDTLMNIVNNLGPEDKINWSGKQRSKSEIEADGRRRIAEAYFELISRRLSNKNVKSAAALLGRASGIDPYNSQLDSFRSQITQLENKLQAEEQARRRAAREAQERRDKEARMQRAREAQASRSNSARNSGREGGYITFDDVNQNSSVPEPPTGNIPREQSRRDSEPTPPRTDTQNDTGSEDSYWQDGSNDPIHW